MSSTSTDHYQAHSEACKHLLLITEELIEDNGRVDDEDLMLKSYECLVRLKSSQRSACHNLAMKSDELKRQKAQLEASELARHNLIYEKDHLLREIASYKDFENKETIKLCESEGFASVSSYLGRLSDEKDILVEPMDQSTHKNVMDRLTQEIEERKKLQEELENFQTECIRIEKDTSKKTSFLKSLPNQLKQIERSTLPLEKQFDMNKMFTGTLRKQRYEKASKLDAPLFTLCCQLEAYSDAFDDRTSVNIISTSSTLTRNSSCKRGRHNEETLMGEYSICLNIKSPAEDQTSSQCSIFFHSVPSMNIVTVHCSEDPMLLDNLFPGDDGRDIPNLSHHHLGINSLDSIHGKPYKWAQWISGYKFLLNNSPSLANHLEIEISAVMKQLLRRLKTRYVLKNIITSLGKLPSPTVFPIHETMRTFFADLQQNNSSSLVSWNEVTDQTEKLEVKDDALGENVGSGSYYKASVRRENQFLDLIVKISCAYPVVAPKWMIKNRVKSSQAEMLSFEVHNYICEIETLVNAQYMSLIAKSEGQPHLDCMDYMLSHQLRFIVAAFDELGNGKTSPMMWRKAIDKHSV